MFELIEEYEKSKVGLWNFLGAKVSDSIKRVAGDAENAKMFEKIQSGIDEGSAVELDPEAVTVEDVQELDILQDTTEEEEILPAEEIEEEAEVDSVDDIISKVENVFPSNNMLSEIAVVESKKGEHPDTYREGYHGGIMQIDEIGFNSTQDVKSHSKLKGKYKKIKDEFGIDWPTVEWEDLRDPLHSVIAARLHLGNKKPEIPDTVEERAKYWKTYYNTDEGKGSSDKYINRLK